MERNLRKIITGNSIKFSIKYSTIKFWKFALEVNIFVKIKIIKISKKTIKFDKNTDKIILLFFFEVLVNFETFRISLIKIFNLFTVLTILLKENKWVNNF